MYMKRQLAPYPHHGLRIIMLTYKCISVARSVRDMARDDIDQKQEQGNSFLGAIHSKRDHDSGTKFICLAKARRHSQ